MGQGSSAPGLRQKFPDDVFENTIFNELELKKIAALYEEGIENVLGKLEPFSLLPLLLSWLKAQALKDDIENVNDNEVMIEQLAYLLDTLHPNQSLENKRDLAWKVYDSDCDGYITQSDLVAVYRHLYPRMSLSKHEVLSRRVLERYPGNKVSKDDFVNILPDKQLYDNFTRTVT